MEHFFTMQREFDRKLGWNSYEKCGTAEEQLKFMEHFVLVMVEELGEISRIRKQHYRDGESLVVEHLKQELMDVFVYFMQACMALKVDLEKEYLKKMKYNEERFLRKST